MPEKRWYATTLFSGRRGSGTIAGMESNREIRRIAAAQYGALSRAQLTAAGLTRHAIARRVAAGTLERSGRHAFTIGGSPVLAARDAMLAVLNAPSGAFLSHRSAAAWWGLAGFDLSGAIEITVPRRGAPTTTDRAHWHYLAPIPPEHVMALKGVRVASPALCLLHLGAVCHPLRVRRAVNNALAARIVTMAGLKDIRRALAGSGRNGVGVLHKILEDFGDSYIPTDSGVELRLDDIARRYGVALERQQWVGDDNERIGRVDFRLATDSRCVVEVLSFKYHSMFLDRLSDEDRFRRLDDSGFRVLRVWDTDIWNHPSEVGEALVDFSLFAHGTVRIPHRSMREKGVGGGGQAEMSAE